MAPSLAKNWCFTINNPTDDEELWLCTHGEEIALSETSVFSYLVFGRETGENNTPHLQGYFRLRTKKRLATIKSLDGFERAHLEVARGTAKQASDYCKKDGDFDEYGSFKSTGNGSQFESLRAWVAAQDPAPTYRDVWEEFPTLAARYKSAVLDCIALFGKRPELVDGPLRPWQEEVNGFLDHDPDDRKIIFVVDPDGNSGKSWLTRYWLTKRDSVQILSVGKRDDLCFSIDVECSLFVFDIPRGQLEFLQYNVLEKLKDRVVFSPKYVSRTKILKEIPHVIVFTNEQPDLTKMTEDRYYIYNVNPN